MMAIKNPNKKSRLLGKMIKLYRILFKNMQIITCKLGCAVGQSDTDGLSLGMRDGAPDIEGASLGWYEGAPVGWEVGLVVGLDVG